MTSKFIQANWTQLIKPKDPVFYKDEDKDKSRAAIMVIEPLERGFGLTLGNALRRVLLSSLQGAAITSVKIDGVLHEYSPIPEVKEDLVNIILQLKTIPIKMLSNHTKTLRLKVRGPKVITSGMIQCDSDVQIIDPDIVICTLHKDRDFEMEFTCQSGKGYVPVRKQLDMPIGVISIDSLFSPVTRVSYNVEKTRIKQDTDYDKLTMKIETNGSITPEDAVAFASRILQTQLSVFLNFEEVSEEAEAVDDQQEINPLLFSTVSILDLTQRCYNCLRNCGIVYVGDLIVRDVADILKIPNCGKTSLNNITDRLKDYGLKLGTKMHWPPEDFSEMLKRYGEASNISSNQ